MKKSLYYDNESRVKEIKLNINERYKKEFTEIGIDATVVEIISTDNISKDFFLLPFIDYMDSFDDLLNKQITIIQYPKGGPLSYADGEIVKIKEYEFTYKASTQNGSSGSPVFLKDNTKIIGIHKSRKKDNSENYGDFIGPIFNYFKNNYNYKILFDKGDYYIGELKNKLQNGKGKEYYDNGKLRFEGKYLYSQRLAGKYYYIDGKLEYEGEYLYDEKWNGKGYDENGNIVYELKNGVGKVKEYDDYNGKLIFEGEYLNGLRNGKGKEYYFGGKVKFEGEYLNGQRNGKGKEYYYKNGELIFEGEYLNDNRWNGKGKEYNFGELIFEGGYLNGIKLNGN